MQWKLGLELGAKLYYNFLATTTVNDKKLVLSILESPHSIRNVSFRAGDGFYSLSGDLDFVYCCVYTFPVENLNTIIVFGYCNYLILSIRCGRIFTNLALTCTEMDYLR
jgi:hypothetical protein